MPRRPDDPRLVEHVAFWSGGPVDLRPGRPVLIGFPQDEGVRRNQGRPGAAAAPHAIRHFLYRLTPPDRAGTEAGPYDLGDIRVGADLEESQHALGEVVAAVLSAGAIPIVLGGGHETAYGHYLGYVQAGREVAILNLDAHLDVRPRLAQARSASEGTQARSASEGTERKNPLAGASGLCQNQQGHSGSPFRQALEHPTQPLRPDRYACLGAQPFAVSAEHARYVLARGGCIRWCSEVRGQLGAVFLRGCERLAADGCPVYVTLDSDVVCQADVPGVSAPNPLGLSGIEVADCAALAGECPAVSSFDLVEINPAVDRDGQSARWAALVVWHFLAGLAKRSG